MRKYLLGVIAMLFLGISGVGCAVRQTPVVSHGGPVATYVSLVDRLRAEGVTVDPTGEIAQPFFSVKGQVITVDRESVQVFEYVDTASAEAEAEQVSDDGSSVGTTMLSWVTTPHFYGTDRLIVLCVGDDAGVASVLETVLGSQFAGG